MGEPDASALPGEKIRYPRRSRRRTAFSSFGQLLSFPDGGIAGWPRHPLGIAEGEVKQQGLPECAALDENAAQTSDPRRANRVAFPALDPRVAHGSRLDPREVEGLAVHEPACRLGKGNPVQATLLPGCEEGLTIRHISDEPGETRDLALLRS